MQVLVTDTAMLWITGRDNDGGSVVNTQHFDIESMADIAVAQGMTTAVLYQVTKKTYQCHLC